MSNHKVEATYGWGGIEFTHKGGLPWWEAARPFWLHRCKPHTIARVDMDQVERCACGAFRVNRRRWWDKNSRTRQSGGLL